MREAETGRVNEKDREMVRKRIERGREGAMGLRKERGWVGWGGGVEGDEQFAAFLSITESD